MWICGTLVAAKINEQEIGSATNINALHTFYFSLPSILWLYVHSFSHRSNEDWSVILCCICADLFTGSSDYEERPPSLSFRSSSGRFVCHRIGQICRTICFNQALQMRHEVVVFRSFGQLFSNVAKALVVWELWIWKCFFLYFLKWHTSLRAKCVEICPFWRHSH